jgi:hypothetical protein
MESSERDRTKSIPQNLPRSGVVQFVGRDPKLQELHTQLQQNESSAPRVRIAITAIAGMGGIGKTELALQYAIALPYPHSSQNRRGVSESLSFLQIYRKAIATHAPIIDPFLCSSSSPPRNRTSQNRTSDRPVPS